MTNLQEMTQVTTSFRRILLIYLILLFWSILWSTSVGGPVMPLYVQSLGAGVFRWSLLATSLALGMLVFEWVWGAMSDRVDRRYLMLFSIITMSVLFHLYTFQFLIPYFLVLQFFSGAIGVAPGPTTRVYVSEMPAQKSVSLFASMWWGFSTLGGIIGPLFGTYLAESCSFSCSFDASAVLALALACFVMLIFPKLKAETRPRRILEPRLGIRQLGSTLKMRSAGFLFLSAIPAFMTASLMRSFLPLYASEQIKMSTVDVGVLLGAISAVQLAAMPFFGWLSHKFGRKRMVSIGFVSSSVIFLFYLVTRTQSQLLFVSVFVSLGLSASSLLLALISDVTPNTLYGTTVGIYGSFEDLGTIFGPLVFGFVWITFAPALIFAIGSLVSLATAILVLAIKPEHTKD